MKSGGRTPTSVDYEAMGQRIGFCTASDGVGIAYATLGSGPPLVYVNGWPGHLELEWDKPHSRELLLSLADGFTLIRYDMRGSGLSDRDVSDFSIRTLVKDLEAVIDHLELSQFPLLALGLLASPIAITYAAANPDRVSAFLLSSAFVKGREITTPERQHALIGYTEAFGVPMSIGYEEVPTTGLRDVIQVQRASASRAMEAALLREMFSADVCNQLERLSMPVLILHGRKDTTIPFGAGRDLAKRLPHARFVPFEGSGSAPWAAKEIIVPEVYRFLGREPTTAAPRAAARAGVATILFTDVEGSTALTQRLGDAEAQELLRTHNAVVRDALKAHEGTEIKHTGDGIMASFVSASHAIECAIAIQQGVATHNQGNPAAAIGVRVGLNAGEPLVEEQDLFGAAVILARRVCDSANAGQILIPEALRHLVSGKGFLSADRGDTVLRGFEDPVRLYEVQWHEKD